MFIYLASIIIVDGPAGGPHRDLIEFIIIIIIVEDIVLTA